MRDQPAFEIEPEAGHRAPRQPADPCVSGASGLTLDDDRQHLSPLRWLPVQTEFSVFMSNETHCPACRLGNAVGMSMSASRLHVRRSGAMLFVTEADDLHDLGRCIQARHAMQLPAMTLYRLVAEPAIRSDKARFRAAAGIVSLSGRNGHLQLRAFGLADTFCSYRDRLFDATEIPCTARDADPGESLEDDQPSPARTSAR